MGQSVVYLGNVPHKLEKNIHSIVVEWSILYIYRSLRLSVMSRSSTFLLLLCLLDLLITKRGRLKSVRLKIDFCYRLIVLSIFAHIFWCIIIGYIHAKDCYFFGGMPSFCYWMHLFIHDVSMFWCIFCLKLI